MRFLSLPVKTLTICGLLVACLAVNQAQDGVDLVFMRRTGLAATNIYGLDVDDPEAEAIALTDYIDTETFLEQNPDADVAEFNPLYADTWRVQYDRDKQGYSLVNIHTAETRFIKECRERCGSRVSPDGRFLLFEAERTIWLADFAQGVDLVELFDAESLAPAVNGDMNWLNATQFIYWYAAAYYVYDTETSQHYSFAETFDPVALTFDVTSAEPVDHKTMLLEPTATFTGDPLPDAIKAFAYSFALSPDEQRIAYVTSDVESPEGEYCDGCAVGVFNITDETSEILFSRSGANGGWRVLSLLWSLDGTRLLTRATEIGELHQADSVWLYDFTTATHREIASGFKYQWLNDERI